MRRSLEQTRHEDLSHMAAVTGFLAAALSTLSSLAAGAHHHRSVDGMSIYIGIIPAGIFQELPRERPESEMHGGPPTAAHAYHLVVALFDEHTFLIRPVLVGRLRAFHLEARRCESRPRWFDFMETLMSSLDHSESPPNEHRRKLLVRATATAGGVALVGAAVPFLASLAPSEREKAAGAPVEVDLGALKPGELATVAWRGKPIWLLRRTEDMLMRLDSARPFLTDPDSRVRSQQPDYARNATRSIKPDLLVTIALCTHLGCVPSYYPRPDSLQSGWPGGFYCPCHGSKFDLAGRVYKGSPAPTNLVVPPHAYTSESRLVIGLDEVKPA